MLVLPISDTGFAADAMLPCSFTIAYLVGEGDSLQLKLVGISVARGTVLQ